MDRHRGYVLHSSVTSGSGGGGSFDLRVPVGSLQATLSDLSGLADVRSRSQNVNDVTSPTTPRAIAWTPSAPCARAC